MATLDWPALLLRLLRIAGLVLESTFTSVGAAVWWGAIFPFDYFRSARRLKTVRAPVLVIHGTADRVVQYPVGRRLFAKAPAPRDLLWVAGAGHDDLVVVAGERYWATLARFAASLPAGAAR